MYINELHAFCAKNAEKVSLKLSPNISTAPRRFADSMKVHAAATSSHGGKESLVTTETKYDLISLIFNFLEVDC